MKKLLIKFFVVSFIILTVYLGWGIFTLQSTSKKLIKSTVDVDTVYEETEKEVDNSFLRFFTGD